MTRISWEQALDELSERLDAVDCSEHPERALGPFEPPAVAEPLPEALRSRVEALIARTDALAGRLQDELDDVRAELRRLPRVPRQPGRSRFEVDA